MNARVLCDSGGSKPERRTANRGREVMGYARYNFNDGKGDRGYDVEDRCHQEGCDKEIDRGLGYLCYGCTGYFCGSHLYIGGEKLECFVGQSSQKCDACSSSRKLICDLCDEALTGVEGEDYHLWEGEEDDGGLHAKCAAQLLTER